MVLRPYFIDPSCVLSLRMMEGVGNFLEDSSGYENHGTNNGATWTSPGHFPTVTGDQCLYFDGNDYINCGNDNSLDNSFPITIEMWIKTPSTTQDFKRIITAGDDFTNGFHVVSITNANCQFGYDDNVAANTKRTAINSIVVDTWQHWAFVIEDTMANAKYYVDGVSGAKINGDGTLTAPGNVIIGAKSDYTGKWTGILDEVRIYNRALSATEILAHYNGGRDAPAR